MTSPFTRTRRQLVRPLLLALAPIVLIMIATAAVRAAYPGIDLTTVIWLFVWTKLFIVTVVVWRFAWQMYRQEVARSLNGRERNDAPHLAD